MMQQAFTYSIWIYFLPLVFIGAFFLLNLTLAVINSKFTEAHKEHAAHEQKLKEKSLGINVDDEDGELNAKEEMSIAQFITARIYAKKMIEFLRMRQAIKRIEQERLAKIKEKQASIAMAKRQIANSAPPVKPASIGSKALASAKDGKLNLVGQIPEDDEEYNEENSDKEQLDRDIQEFLKNSRLHMQRQTHLGKPLADKFANKKKDGALPTMKGNIGPSKKITYVDPENTYVN